MAVLDSRKRDPEATRAGILDAAQNLFVSDGFAATSMAHIARDAHVTKSLIHHHFGSKEELWLEVKQRCVEQWALAQEDLFAQRDADGHLLLAASLESYFHFLKESPEWVRLQGWMNLEADPRLNESTQPQVVEKGVERIRRAQKDGTLRSDVDARHVLAMFIGLCNFWFQARVGFEAAGIRNGKGDPDGEYLADVIRIFLAGMRP